jgi:hypothetical protein
MNKKRRQHLARIVAELELELSELETVRDEEAEAFARKPGADQEPADKLETAYDELEAVISNLNEIASS